MLLKQLHTLYSFSKTKRSSARSNGEAAWGGGGCSDYSDVEDGDPEGEFEWMQAGDGDF